jgi:SAM-dependent methyltransferase
MDERVFVKSQYATSTNLEDRMQIYTYSITDIDWHTWLFQQLAITSQQKILEVGCGNGMLWKKNADQLPQEIEIILTDQSEEMINAARENLAASPQVRFQVMKIEDLHFEENTFDLVIANHMLYHVPDIEQALREVRRVLKSQGTLIAATNSQEHQRELKDALLEFDPTCEYPKGVPLRFLLENGAQILDREFSRIEVRTFTNCLKIPDVQPITRFILSMFDGVKYPDLRPRVQELEQHIRSKMQDGIFTLTGKSGIFLCQP